MSRALSHSDTLHSRPQNGMLRDWFRATADDVSNFV